MVKADQIIVNLREDICDWTAKIRFAKVYKNKTLVGLFMWKGMSTWWLNRLANKVTSGSTKWVNRLIVLYMANEFSSNRVVNLVTDDKILSETFKKNKDQIAVNIFYKPKRLQKVQSLYSCLCNIGTLFGSFLRHFLVYISVSKLKTKFNCDSNKKPIIWFKISYPINWKAGASSTDRLLGEAPLSDYKHQFESVYLVFTTLSSFNVIKYKKAVKNLHRRAQRRVAFPEAELSLKDILGVYFSTLCEHLKFILLSKSQKFKSAFVLNGLDVSDIFLAEWSKSYCGYQQFSKLQAISHSKFFEKFSGQQTVVTYGEFFPQNRACYFLTKKTKKDISFIAIQHAMNAKNKMFTYYRADEFKYDEVNHGKDYSPYPDYFLVQGKQYYNILSEFFPSEKIQIIGSLKQFEVPKSINKDIFGGCRQVGKKLLLLAPSVGDDYKIILSFFDDWTPLNDWQIVLCPHPVSDIEQIKNYQKRVVPNVSINILEKGIVYEVLSKSNLVVTVNSTIALEAGVFGVKSVRLTLPWVMNQFDHDKRIKSFSCKFLFQKWLKNYDPLKCNNASRKIIYDYFHKNDGNASDRLWNFLTANRRKSNISREERS